MNRPRVSIIMPCYQNGRTAADTVRSIQAQTEADWELIAVDDGSTDDTLAVLERLAREEPRMRVIHQENGGVSAARNAGMDAAKGEWLSFVDADDVLLPQALAHLLALTDAETDVACGAYVMRYGDEGGREEKHVCADGDLQTILESLIRGDSALNSMCARLYRTQMIRERGVRAPLGVKVGEDVLFNLDAFMAARAWRMSEETIYIYEFGGDSAMTRARRDFYARSVPLMEGVGRFIDANGLATALFRAHIDLYVRTLRADRGRFRAALSLSRAMVARIVKGVAPGSLPLKQRLYYAALRVLPASSYLLP
ncbi:MAG: glycosyltransferase [Christensenellales bacterium]|nr:glycosyltransferase [Christensenellales bacterium]